ncbi:NRDE family protein [Alteromonas gilva]|uniref:NRDE family protein n=1 Tax=Alteromonas gilva TaxID=2987522 RepID=A0ABT5L2V2_9ALTE|nr:NRDE family protein [Alteromonas gilva]MDC8831208.1 NRDE family protein [Alteromonas gilva]
MCIVFIALQQHPDYPLIIAANRDEFYARPTQSSHFWPQSPTILAGKDLKAGGSWMGITRSGDIAALTNIRDPSREQPSAGSRGALVADFLTRPRAISDYCRHLRKTVNQYNGYNLLFGNYQQLAVFNSHTQSLQQLAPGFHGLSNARLNTPWPKVTRGTDALANYVKHSNNLYASEIFRLLADDTPALPDQLPDTGVSKAWEQRLSPIFIRTPEYGTRSSTIIMISKDANVDWYEKVFPSQATSARQNVESHHFSWKIQHK